MLTKDEKRMRLSSDRAGRLSELLDDRVERQGWSFASEASLERIWDNDEDSAYDNWRELYGVPTRRCRSGVVSV